MTRLSWILVILAACAGERAPDAYGNFEAVEVVVSAQTTGEVLSFTPVNDKRSNSTLACDGKSSRRSPSTGSTSFSRSTKSAAPQPPTNLLCVTTAASMGT